LRTYENAQILHYLYNVIHFNDDRLRSPQALNRIYAGLYFGVCWHIFELDIYRNGKRKKFRNKNLNSDA